MKNAFLKRIEERFIKFRRGDFDDIPSCFRSRYVAWLLFIALISLVSFLTTVSLQYLPKNIEEGMIAVRDIKADQNYEIVDVDATEKIKQEATNEVLSVYDLDDLQAESIAERIRLAFANTRLRFQAILDAKKQKVKPGATNLTEEENDELKKVFSDSLGVVPTGVQWKFLAGERFDERSEAYLINLVRKLMDMPIVADKTTLDAEAPKGIVVRKIVEEKDQEPVYEEITVKEVGNLTSVLDAKELALKIDVRDSEFKEPSYVEKIKPLVSELVVPNLSMNRGETQKRRDNAAESVANIIIKIKSGEMIIREGQRFEPWHIKVLSGIKLEKMKGLYHLKFFGTFILVFLFISTPFFLVERLFKRIAVGAADHVLMAVVGISVLIVARISIMLAPALQNSIFFNAPTAALYFAIPVAGGTMLIRMYLGAEVSTIFAVVVSLLAGLLIEGDISFIAYYLMTNFMAVIAMTHVDKRSQIIRAGISIGTVGVVTILGSKLVAMATSAEPVLVSNVMWSLVIAVMGGIGCSIFAMIAAPVVESFSGYTSDIKLLELANLNHPLIRELIVRAPGTYHHSHLVGVLGEAAAESIGANALLVRVGAYYHDLGKMKKPLYFIENSRPGENRHEKLSPSMSALIVSAHVKDGLDMAVKSGIPKVITDMIPEHHGTRTMDFFYSKAKELAGDSETAVDEKEFQYPGPKPKTTEAAILMLADATEAAVRSLKEKGSARIQQTVERVINDIFAESQLDECELTLKDLNDIAKAFVRILLGIYHQRIEYPRDENDKPEISILEETDVNEDAGDKPK